MLETTRKSSTSWLIAAFIPSISVGHLGVCGVAPLPLLDLYSFKFRAGSDRTRQISRRSPEGRNPVKLQSTSPPVPPFSEPRAIVRHQVEPDRVPRLSVVIVNYHQWGETADLVRQLARSDCLASGN